MKKYYIKEKGKKLNPYEKACNSYPTYEAAQKHLNFISKFASVKNLEIVEIITE